MGHTPRALETHVSWRATDIADPAKWTVELTAGDHRELDAALRQAKTISNELLHVDREAFPLDGLKAKLAEVERELIDGRGFVRIRGLDAKRYSDDDLTMLYWGIGMHLGDPWPQNKHGHVMGDVTDQGRRASDPTARGNELGPVGMPYHSDGSDLVGLMCLRKAISGGISTVANAVLAHNEMVRTRPDLAAELYQPMIYDFRGEEQPGHAPTYTVPVFTRHGHRLFVRYIRPYIESTRRHDDAPRITDAAREAMNRVDAMCADPQYHVSMTMQPGDMQFVNNYHVLHARRAYEDDRPAGRIRHLKRLWLETDLLAVGAKPERFRLGRTDSYWASKGRTKSELNV